MNWTSLRDELLRAWRENGECSVIITFASGKQMSGKITQDALPSTWKADEMIIFSRTRTGVTRHMVATTRVDVVSVAGDGS